MRLYARESRPTDLTSRPCPESGPFQPGGGATRNSLSWIAIPALGVLNAHEHEECGAGAGLRTWSLAELPALRRSLLVHSTIHGCGAARCLSLLLLLSPGVTTPFLRIGSFVPIACFTWVFAYIPSFPPSPSYSVAPRRSYPPKDSQSARLVGSGQPAVSAAPVETGPESHALVAVGCRLGTQRLGEGVAEILCRGDTQDLESTLKNSLL